MSIFIGKILPQKNNVSCLQNLVKIAYMSLQVFLNLIPIYRFSSFKDYVVNHNDFSSLGISYNRYTSIR